MELDSLPCFLKPIIGSYPEPDESNHQSIALYNNFFTVKYTGNYVIFSKIHHFFLGIRRVSKKPA
jgi:hypothetical protein